MNIIDAIASGKQIKRSSWTLYIDPSKPIPQLSSQDLTATDWGVLQANVTVTSAQIQSAWGQTVMPTLSAVTDPLTAQGILTSFINALGLG